MGITYVPPRNNKAKNIKIDDTANNFQGNDVEDALKELAESTAKIDDTSTDTNETWSANKLSTQFNTKANLNEIWSMVNMGQDVKQAMTGGSVAVVGVKSISNDNVIPSSLSELTLTDCVRGKNLINEERIKYGFYIKSSTGEIVTGTSSTGIDCITEFIPIDKTKTTLMCNKPRGAIFFDSNLKFISGEAPVDNPAQVINIPPNTSYVVLNLRSSNINKIQLEYGITSTLYEKYYFNLNNLNIDNQINVNLDRNNYVNNANIYIIDSKQFKFKIIDTAGDNRGKLYLTWGNQNLIIRVKDTTYSNDISMLDKNKFDSSVLFELIDNIEYIVIPHVNILVYNLFDRKIKCKSYTDIDYSKEVELINFAWSQIVKGELSKYLINNNSSTESEISQIYKNKTREIQNNLFNTFNDNLSYVQITDLHSDYDEMNKVIDRQLNSIVNLSNTNGFDFITLTGDITSGSNAKEVTMNRLTEIVELLKRTTNTPILFLNGNHDDNSYCVNENVITEDKLISKQEWYNRVIAPFKLGEVHDTQDKFSRYYYLDLPNKKIRLICLDASDAPKEYLEGGIVKYHGRNWWGYGNRQVHWLNEILTDVSNKEGWNVIILSHMCARPEIASRNMVYKNGKVLEDIISSFQNATTFNGTCLDNTIVSCNFINNQNKVLAYHYGHNHASIRYKQNVNFLYSCTPNANAQVIDSSIIPINVGFKIPTPRTINTITEGCYDIFKLTPTNLISYRFGAGDNENVSI